MPAPTNSAVRLQRLTAPEIAGEIGIMPVLDSIIMLIMRPSISLSVRVVFLPQRIIFQKKDFNLSCS